MLETTAPTTAPSTPLPELRRAAPDCSLYTLTLDGITHIVSYEAVVSLYDDLCQEFGA